MTASAPTLDVGTPFELLSQMVEDISGELALEPLLARIIERACKLIGADDGVIGLYVPELDAIRTAASYNIDQQELRSILPRGTGLTGRVLELDEAVRCRYGDLPHPTRVAALEMRMIGMPIRAQGRLIGVFGIGVWPPAELDGSAQAMLDLFARHAAIAIDNARRYAEEQRRAARFALIARLAAVSATGPDVESLLQHAADCIHETLDYPHVDIPLVYPDEPDTLSCRIRGGAYKHALPLPAGRQPIGEGIMGAAASQRRTQLVNDAANDPRYLIPPGVTEKAVAELAIPIVHGEELLGVLNIESDRPFDELDRTSLEIVAEQLGIAIVNARLYEQATHVALLEERQRLARDLHDSVTQILASMSLIAQSLTESWQRNPAEGERRASRLVKLAQLGFAELRGLLHELAPSDAPIRDSAHGSVKHGMPAKLRRLLEVMVPEPIRLHVDSTDYRPQLPAHEEAVLRVCQEAVSNAVRHASPTRIAIRLSSDDDAVRLCVFDDGCGLPDAAAPGMGLRNMRERVGEQGGTLMIAAGTPRGTRIEALIPSAN